MRALAKPLTLRQDFPIFSSDMVGPTATSEIRISSGAIPPTLRQNRAKGCGSHMGFEGNLVCEPAIVAAASDCE
jgi:hypothetical protein